MIVTLTANPSIDRTLALPQELIRGAVQRSSDSLDQAGGKGINIARAATGAGLDCVAVLPGQRSGFIAHELARAGVRSAISSAAGAPRTNLAITEPDGTTTKLNGTGQPLSPDELQVLERTLLVSAREADWVVLAGSLPPGVPDDWYARLIRALPVPVALDTSGAPLAAVIAASPAAAPALLTPNADELAELVGTPAAELESDPGRAARAASELVGAGVGSVLVTLGSHGAVLVDADGAWHAAAPQVRVRSTVGAGDSALFGLISARLDRLAPADQLRRAVAWGSASAALEGSGVPTPELVRESRVVARALD